MRWSELEDMVLQSKNDKQVAYLIKSKGQEAVEARRIFLGIWSRTISYFSKNN